MNTRVPNWTITLGESPLVATAIHNGHYVRNELNDWLAISEEARLREEDPFTGECASIADTHIIVHRSRFEVDMNRSMDTAIYQSPEDAWGMQVWKNPLPPDVIARSLSLYETFYDRLETILQEKSQQHDRFVILDIHSYNYRRSGANAPPAPVKENPEVIVGTSNMDSEYWAPVVTRFIKDLTEYPFEKRHLDVRKDIKFRGGYMARWIHDTFPRVACVLSIEFKKVFMDEWTGEPYPDHIDNLQNALQSTVPGLYESLESY